MNPFVLAWRNVWRNTRRTLATVAAMTLALWTMITYAGLMEGYLVGMERNLLDLEMGDVQVFNLEYRTKPSLYHQIENHQELLAQLDREGYPAAARLLGAGLAASGETSAGVSLRGVEVERDKTVSLVYQRVASGQWLDPDDSGGVVIGRRLARVLGAGIGDEMVVLSQATDGSMANELYRVRGILSAVSDGVDRGGVYMNAAAFRELFTLPEGAHQIIVRRPSNVPLEVAAARVSELSPRLESKTWRALTPTLASMFDSSRGALIMMFIIVYAAIGIVILNAMLMAVFERVREFGVLKALGVGPGGVLSLIVLESMVQTAVAIVAAGIIAIPTTWYFTTVGIDLGSVGNFSVMGLAWDPIWRMEPTAGTVLKPVIVLTVIVAVAVIYPALRAAFIRPVEAMRSR